MIYGKLDEKEMHLRVMFFSEVLAAPFLSRIVSQVLSSGAFACLVPQPDQKALPDDWRPVRGPAARVGGPGPLARRLGSAVVNGVTAARSAGVACRLEACAVKGE